MIKRRLFGSTKLMELFIESLIEVETLDDGWSKKYHNDLTKEYWLKYIVDDRTSASNLILLTPRPDTNELINILFTSPFPDEVSASATRLYLDEKENKLEFREKLIDKLDEIDLIKLSDEEKQRIKKIITNSTLMHGMNIREIMSKHYSEVMKDAAFFNSISERAKEIWNKLQA